MKITERLFMVLTISCLMCKSATAQNSESQQQLRCVVIDAGHGGEVPGATWGNYKEKTITLNVALRLGKRIKEEFADVKVIYTRQSDVAVDLYKRSQIANEAKADLFISIHVNSSRSSEGYGVETFVMGYDQSAKNMEVAKKENSVITYEDNYESKYEGFDPNSSESYIVFSLMQYSFLEQSRIFASATQKEYMRILPTRDRGVKQAAFLVLWRTTMPSVLTEIGFLSNPSDRKFLLNTDRQNEIADALFRAFVNYKRQVDSGVKTIEENYPVIEDTDTEGAGEQAARTETKKIEPTSQPASKPTNVVYKVQISSSKVLKKSTKDNFGKYASRVEVVKSGSFYKYYISSGESYKTASKLLSELRKGAFKDAFIVAYKNGKSISVQDARKITKE